MLAVNKLLIFIYFIICLKWFIRLEIFRLISVGLSPYIAIIISILVFSGYILNLQFPSLEFFVAKNSY